MRCGVGGGQEGGGRASSLANNKRGGGGFVSSLPVDAGLGVSSGDVDKLIRRRVCAKSSRCERETAETVFERVRPNFPPLHSLSRGPDRSETFPSSRRSSNRPKTRATGRVATESESGCNLHRQRSRARRALTDRLVSHRRSYRLPNATRSEKESSSPLFSVQNR